MIFFYDILISMIFYDILPWYSDILVFWYSMILLLLLYDILITSCGTLISHMTFSLSKLSGGCICWERAIWIFRRISVFQVWKKERKQRFPAQRHLAAFIVSIGTAPLDGTSRRWRFFVPSAADVPVRLRIRPAPSLSAIPALNHTQPWMREDKAVRWADFRPEEWWI